MDSEAESKAPTTESFSIRSTTTTLLEHFLPAQYPQSVAPGYLQFTAFAFTASVAGSAAMVLSTQSLLLAVGVVGSSNVPQAGIMAGAFNWVMKDLIGQLGGVLFASQMGKTRAFDADPKRWRMVAAMTLDGATLMEILSPMLPSVWLLPVAGIANIGKNIGFLTASASRASINQALAIRGNLGDVTAKAGSQAIVASLMGTTIGIGMSSLLAHDTYNFTLGFCVLGCIHQISNYLSLQSVPLAHFNRQRLQILLETYLSHQKETDDNDGSVLSPVELAKKESFFPFMGEKAVTNDWLTIGSPLQTVCPTPIDLLNTLQSQPEQRYVIMPVQNNDSKASNNNNNNNSHVQIHLVFFQDAAGDDVIRGMYHAYLLHKHFEQTQTEKSTTDVEYNERIQEKLQKTFPILLQEIKTQGWSTRTVCTTIETREARRLDIQYDRE